MTAQMPRGNKVAQGRVVVEVVEMAIADIKAAPFNPPSRIEKKALRRLKIDIEKAGRIIVPLIVTKDGWLADGHRRLACARELGFETVPVIIVSDIDLNDLWPLINDAMMSVRGRTWVEAVDGGLPLESVPDKERAQISEMQRVLGESKFHKIAANGRSPYILTCARSAARYVADETDRFLRVCILWLDEYGQQRPLIDAMRDRCQPEVIVAAIRDGRELRKYWGVAS